MKTSVIEVRDMLSVLSVDAVEKRIGGVPGVESVTVNYAARNATVRFDETHIEVGDIKASVRHSGYQSEGEAPAGHRSEHSPAQEHTVASTAKADSAPAPADVAQKPPSAAGVMASMPSPAAPKPMAEAHSAVPGAPADDAKSDKAARDTPPSPPMSAMPVKG